MGSRVLNIGKTLGAGTKLFTRMAIEVGKAHLSSRQAKKEFEAALVELGLPKDVIRELSAEFPRPNTILSSKKNQGAIIEE